MKGLIRFSIIEVLQIVGFLLIYHIGYYLFEILLGEVKNDLSWGLSLRLFFFTFLIVTILANIINAFVPRLRTLVSAVGIIIFVTVWALNIGYSPYKSFLVLLSAIIGFAIPFFFGNVSKHQIKKIN